MNHKIILKTIGAKAKTLINNIVTEHPIIDVVFSNGVFYFIHGNKIGIIDKDGVNCEWLDVFMVFVDGEFKSVTLDNPSSIFSYMDSIYIVEKSGKQIIKLDKYENNYALKGENLKVIDYLMRRVDNDASSSIFVDNVGVTWTSTYLNMVVLLSHTEEMATLIGNGRCGDAIANNADSCTISMPEGLCKLNGILYLSDTGNKKIKGVKNGKMFLINGTCNNPTKIKIFNDRLVFIDNNSIKNIINNSIVDAPLYNSNNLECFCSDDKQLFIVERV